MDKNSPYHKRLSQAINASLRECFGVDLEMLASGTRVRCVSYLRAIVCYILRNDYQMTYDEIGKLLNRKHPTIIYEERLAKQLKINKGFMCDLKLMQKMVKTKMK